MRSETTSADTLSRSRPPYSSGTLMPRRPSSPARRTRARARAQSFVSSWSIFGSTSLSTNSSTVCAIRRCSSDSFSGVNVDEGSVSSSSHEAPLCEVLTIVIFAPGGSARYASKQRAEPALHSFEDSCGAHPATDAHRHHSISRLTPPHLVDQCRRQLGARAAEWMAERDRAAVDVETLWIDRQLAQACQHLRG